MKRFYLLMLMPALLFAACNKKEPLPTIGSGNVTFLDNDDRYDSVHVNNTSLGGDGLVAAHLVYATDDDVAIVLKNGSYDPNTAGDRKLEYINGAGKTLLRKDVFTPPAFAQNQLQGYYNFYPVDSDVFFTGYTTQAVNAVVYHRSQQIIAPGAVQGRPVMGINKQLAVIGNTLTHFYNYGTEVENYYNVRNSALLFAPDGSAGNHKAYTLAFRKDSNFLEVRAMNPGTTPPASPGGPKVADLLLKVSADGVTDSVRWAWVQGQTFGGNLYVLGVTYYTNAQHMLLNTYVYNSDSNIIRLVRSNVPLDGLVPMNFDDRPSTISLHFWENGGVWLTKTTASSKGYDLYRLTDGNIFENYTPRLRSEGFVQSVRTSKKKLYLTVGDGGTRAEVVRLKQ